MTERVVRVLLVDDQELVRTGLRGILRPRFGFEIVGELDSGEGIVEAVAPLRPHVVVMDVRMPRVDGVTATTPAGRPARRAAGARADDLRGRGDPRRRAACRRRGLPAQGRARRRPAARRPGGRSGRLLARPDGVTGRVLAAYREGTTPAWPAPSSPCSPPGTRGARPDRAGLNNTEIATALMLGGGDDQDPHRASLRQAQPPGPGGRRDLRLQPRPRATGPR